MAKLKTIALTLSGLSAVSGAAAAQNATPNQTGMAMMRLNSALLDQAKAKTFGSGSLWASLKKDFRMSEVNSELVRRHESKFAANGAYFDRTITRSKPYMYHIATEVKKRNMPAEIALLPFIESAFVTKAKSHVGASGLWQFMPATGRHFGLEKTPLYDGRHDVYAATDAALNYLQYLHGLFNDWSLALAAYNWGEGNVGRAVNRARAQGLEPTYENLRMPNETRNYVPKLLAVRNIVASPQTFGMNISEITNQPYFQTVSIDKPIDNSTIARLANISESELLTLNPAFNAPVFIPKNNRKLLLPVSAVSAFEKNYRNANPETLLSFNAYTSARNTNLNTIATETGMSVAEIKRLNGLNSNSLSEGRTILVAQTDTATKQDMINFIDTDNTPDTYRSNMPTMAPIQTAELKTDTVKKVVAPANTVAQEPAPTTFDFVANTKAATAPIAADAVTTAQPRVERVQTVQSTEAKPATDTTVIAAAEPAQPALTLTEPQVVASAKSATPSTPSAVEEPDQLMALLSNVDSSLQKTEEHQTTVAQDITLHQEVDATKARSERIAENIAKHQSRTEARLARANNQSSAQPTTMAGMHRVADGDTLFNISKRYNLSVADLIVTNNIKGSNIRKGQLLRVSADPVKTRKNNIQNVSYTVRRGDTLNTIADRFNIDVNDIRRWNKNTRTVTPGQRLKLMGS
ncbi:LysM peptidoglycan-binding domain-containing protein [Neisseria mucosa]|jgi:transglycosylase SLT/lysM domain protein|uniref:LysM peptidoglycan-binding domain-containing protein n=2 Tax=Neisseriaceae TaxID=481 RepID=A0A0C1GWG1_9NEIS|nr:MULTISPECIES: LysM peptidoglycan-binding domain-containing protein [Neisseriaceae]OFJ59499.1 lytic transglycosylase [Neisseria sp. HMSC073B07]OFT23627.1 lytic transglycosylase [Neisseria sp. HMSC03D10]KIC09741.1 murein transglycosylase [Morococcus cerebrosus]MDK6726222.1 LysM peptidoglycan-binding domain-containing protein [Neisseria mucosa]MDK6870548.1 LysM peptidoglycan-binding domain-containing protein [Neisseria mucosa]